MGIQGLLKGLQPFSDKCNIRDFAGQSLAVDASSWLHKSVYSVSEQYVESIERSTIRVDPQCVRVATKYVERRCEEMLKGANIRTIFLVLDGIRCPLKAPTTGDREQRRQTNLADARKYKKQGKRDKAEEKYKMCIKIHRSFANAVAAGIKKLYSRGGRVQCISSPHEADAQLVKLCKDKMADAIVTEDSDVLVYSASCHVPVKIIYKLDKRSGSCDVVSMDWLLDWNKERARKYQKRGGAMESHLLAFADRQSRRPGHGVRLFVQACVLAGSDYSPSQLNGVGTVTAFKLIRETSHRDCGDRFRAVLSSLTKKQKGDSNMIDYEELLAKSEAVFYLHPVVEESTKSTVTLTSPKYESSGVDETGVVKYNPLLQRFGGDLTFLGDYDFMDGSQPSQQCETSPLTSFPVIEVRGNKPVSKRSSKQAGSEVDILLQAAKDDRKTTRTPFANVSNSPAAKSNPFLKAGFKKKEPKEAHAKHAISGVDLRFVKRKFRRDGKPIKNPNQTRSTNELFPKLALDQPTNREPSALDVQVAAQLVSKRAPDPPKEMNEFDLPIDTKIGQGRSFYDCADEDSVEEEPIPRSNSFAPYQGGATALGSFGYNPAGKESEEPFTETELTTANSFKQLDSAILQLDDVDDVAGTHSRYFSRPPRRVTRSPTSPKDSPFGVSPTLLQNDTIQPQSSNTFRAPLSRRVTKSPTSPENEFKIASRASTRTATFNKAGSSSPSDESNISEIDDFQVGYSAGVQPDVTDLTAEDDDSPFRFNFNNKKQSTKRKSEQSTLVGLWPSSKRPSSSSSSRSSGGGSGWFNSKRRKQEPKGSIAHYFSGYQSVVDEKEDPFMGF